MPYPDSAAASDDSATPLAAFSDYLETLPDYRDRREAGDDDPLDDPGRRPPNAHARHQVLRDAAVAFAANATVTRYTDLVRPAFLANTAGDPAIAFPPLIHPPDPDLGDPDSQTGAPVAPAIELLWNYWLEEGLLPETIRIITATFANRHLRDRVPVPLLGLSPLTPLHNELWAYAQDKPHRLKPRVRAALYAHEYGLTPAGRRADRVVETRTRFIPSFHRLLHTAARFFADLDDLTRQATNTYPLFIALRDCHLVLADGADNTYGAAVVTCRAEFLVMQHLLSEPDLGNFLGNPMAVHTDPWIGIVDAMAALQGWETPSGALFLDLANTGERLLLSIRLGAWAGAGIGDAQVRTWVLAFRADVDHYIAAYRAVTGVDLARQADNRPPAALLTAARASGKRRPRFRGRR